MRKQNPGPAASRAITIVVLAALWAAPLPAAQAADDEPAPAALLEDYRAAVQSLDRLSAHNRHLRQVIENLEVAKSARARQLDNYRRTGPELVPLMKRMVESLGEFVERDLPFDLEARRARVQELADNLGRPEIADAEKLRRILDAYQVETGFGRDIDATVGWLEVNGSRREVSFLRVGRLVLAYQTHDRAETGFFNPATREWELLPDEYRNSVAEGLRIAKKQAAPVLLRLPVPAPEAAD